MISKEILFNGLRVHVLFTPPSPEPVRSNQVEPPEGGELLVDGDIDIDDEEEWADFVGDDEYAELQTTGEIRTYLKANCLDALWQEVLRGD